MEDKMLTADQLEKYAEVLFWGLKTARKERFKKNDIILIQYDPAAVKLAERLYARILDRGLHPVQRQGLTCGMEHDFYKRSREGQLVFITPGDKELRPLHGDPGLSFPIHRQAGRRRLRGGQGHRRHHPGDRERESARRER